MELVNTQEHQPDMKLKYDEMLKEVAQNKPPKVLMRRQWVRMMIQRILSARDIMESEDKSNLPEVVREALDNYDVDYTKPEPRLITKRKRLDDPIKFVIALEDSFEIVLKAHLFTHHGGCTDMNRWLSNFQYELSIVCVPVLISVCKRCFLGTDDPQIRKLEERFKNPPNTSEDIISNKSKSVKSVSLAGSVKDMSTSKHIKETTLTPTHKIIESLKNIYTSLSFVNILDMSLRPDRSFHYLLVHQDVKTEFVQIRPLTDHDLAEEVSMELIKLFCDFAPPQCLVIQTEVVGLFESVLQRLNVIFNPKILCEICESDENTVCADIETKMSEWTTDHSCDSWSIGCHFIQYQMNNHKSGDRTSPYEKFYGIKLQSNETRSIDSPTNKDKDVQKSAENQTESVENSQQNVTLKDVTASTDLSSIAVKNLSQENIIINSSPQISEVTSEAQVTHNPDTAAIPDLDNVNIKVEPETEERTEPGVEAQNNKQKHICCTCKDLMRTQVYLCCKCKRSLHLYCGARRKGPDNVMENICYTCINS